MPDSVTICRLGEPVAWARTRGSGKNRYTPAVQRGVGDELRRLATQEMRGCPPFECALRIEVLAEFGIPESWSKQQQIDAIGAPHTSKPDADNILKIVKDSLGAPRTRGKQLHPGIVYKDDAKISAACIKKRYGVQPKLVITIMPDNRTNRAKSELTPPRFGGQDCCPCSR